MKIIDPSYEILTPIDGIKILKAIEIAGRTCYKSENKITSDSCKEFVKNIIKRGHESVLEHISLSVRFIANRGFTHCLVRHRLCAYSQESTMYCNYSKDKFDNGVTFIRPRFFKEESTHYLYWKAAMDNAEEAYLSLLNIGAKPREARGVLPIDVKTEIVITTNLRQWRYILKLRTGSYNHDIEKQLYRPLLTELREKIPIIFDDITYKE